jgi:hypothetical protein
LRRSVRPDAATTSSTSSGGNTRVSTPEVVPDLVEVEVAVPRLSPAVR